MAGAGRWEWKRSLLAERDTAQQIVGAPGPQNFLDAVERRPARNQGNRSQQDNPEIAPQSTVFDVEQGETALPRSNHLVVEQIGIWAASEYFTFIREDDGG